MAGLGSLGGGNLMPAAQALSLPADDYGNDQNLEMMWAMKAYEHAEIYFNLICSVDPRFLKLTREDDQIYEKFRKQFRDMKVDILDPNELKSETAKLEWRPFCLQFETLVEDFNYGTLLRLDCSKDYVEENTIFATRIQFFAIEIARNREGHNTALYETSAKAKAASVGENFVQPSTNQEVPLGEPAGLARAENTACT
ncbi:protein PBDC1 [Heterodontus francisci]|uniref:protein PBDC1 n=1 Tax=Heterodontus francisci TaxID=7792 RepID=UPI00355B2FC9